MDAIPDENTQEYKQPQSKQGFSTHRRKSVDGSCNIQVSQKNVIPLETVSFIN
eukprot:m.21273 g.21273  ORF g.21273 m.21273 type:complete len:53 (-) comp7097_c0_seq2:67-225(-)